MKKILKKMDNIILKEKVILLLIICVLIPMITTNSYILLIVKNGMNKGQKQKLENMADRLEFELYDSISQQISIADYLNRNEKLNVFLDRDYRNESEYYEAYVQLLEDEVIQYYYTAQSTRNIIICTNNETITNGMYFVKQKDVEHTSWYQAFLENEKNTCLYSYFEDGKESSGYVEKGRRIIIMQKMNNCEKDSFIMLDLDYQKMLEKIQMVCDNADGYVCSADRILFSTVDKNGEKKDFSSLNTYEEKYYSLQRDLELYGEKLSIYLTAEKNPMFQIIKEQKSILILLYVFNLLLPIVFVYILYKSLYDRISATKEYLELMKEGVYEVLPIEEGTDEIGDMLHSYNLMVVKIKELIEVVFKNKEREQSLEISKKQAELNALQSQLNPHFIFNALESIRMHSILKQEIETAKILENFAVLMRKNIQWDQDFITIEEEYENVKRYLEIQKYRFGDRLEYSLYIQEECKQYKIPKFIVITFVENACVHGIEKSVEGGSITVMVSEDEESLYFEIMDRGSGMEKDELEHLQMLIAQADINYIQNAKKSIGIMNAVVRMKQYYGEGVQIDINSTAHEGTEICIRLPKMNEESREKV